MVTCDLGMLTARGGWSNNLCMFRTHPVSIVLQVLDQANGMLRTYEHAVLLGMRYIESEAKVLRDISIPLLAAAV